MGVHNTTLFPCTLNGTASTLASTRVDRAPGNQARKRFDDSPRLHATSWLGRRPAGGGRSSLEGGTIPGLGLGGSRTAKTEGPAPRR